MKVLTYFITGLLGLFALTSCGDFLQEVSQNKSYVNEVQDLNELLIGEGYWIPGGGIIADTTADGGSIYWSRIDQTGLYFPYIHLMDDDVSEYLYGYTGTSEDMYIRLKASHLHHWQRDPFLDARNAEIKDQQWLVVWEHIAAMNSLLFQLGELHSGEDEMDLARKVEGEARFLRAQYYFWLANLYGRPYCKASATTDLCIPLKTTEVVEDRYFSRATMAEVYGTMVADLERAVVCLRGIEQPTKHRVNQEAAFVLLSRLHLYMEEYDKAVACVDSVLSNSDYGLEDLNQYKAGTSAITLASRDVLFSHGPVNIMAIIHPSLVTRGNWTTGYTSSDELLETYVATDLRKKAYFMKRESPAAGFRCVKSRLADDQISDIFTIRLAEAYLNKAEALALLGRDGEARETVDILRSKRFAPADFVATSESGKDLIQFVRDERRRELCFEGHRWFDLRRYAVNGVAPFTKSIEHVSLAYDEGTASVYTVGKYVLKPYPEDVAAYMLPIPRYAIEFNQGELTNEIRNEREIIVE